MSSKIDVFFIVINASNILTYFDWRIFHISVKWFTILSTEKRVSLKQITRLCFRIYNASDRRVAML